MLLVLLLLLVLVLLFCGVTDALLFYGASVLWCYWCDGGVAYRHRSLPPCDVGHCSVDSGDLWNHSVHPRDSSGWQGGKPEGNGTQVHKF